jgi:membrane protease YdiL (CAAX protease family)
MHDRDQRTDSHRTWNKLTHVLRRSPALRSVVYLSGAAAMLHVSTRVCGRDAAWSLEASHIITMPVVTAWTRAFHRLHTEDKADWCRQPCKQGLEQAVAGMALGTGAFLVVVGAAYVQGWVRFPGWGWEMVSKREVARTLLLHAIGHGAMAWNEELVFRGYGLDTVTAAVGPPGAMLALVTLFALGHGSKPRVLVSQGVGGLALTFLRLSSHSLWLPFGYHFGWNYVQTAVLGPPDDLPSLRPMYPQGPELWLGRPGYPEPGLLATIVELGIAVGSALVWWRGRHRR